MKRSLMCAVGLLALMATAVVGCQPPTSPTTGAAETPMAPTEAAAPTAEVYPTTVMSPTTGMTSTGATDALGGDWTLVSYGPTASPTMVPEGVTATAKFATGTMSGNNGCNMYNATYQLDGAKLTITPGISTMMACPDPAGAVEQAFMAALPEVTGFTNYEGSLTLAYGDAQALVFKAAMGSGGLAGTNWEVTGYNNGKEAVVSLAAKTAISLTFGTDGRVSGRACNTYNGPFTEDGRNVKIGPLINTRMMCVEEGIMEQEAAYLTALQAATTWSLDGGALWLRDAAGATQVTAKPAVATR